MEVEVQVLRSAGLDLKHVCACLCLCGYGGLDLKQRIWRA
jgi:hypothetical protein